MASQNKLLQLGLHEDVGWALTDTLAAQAWGMPVVVSPNYPPDFYVPSIIALQRATAQLGRADDPDSRACTVAVAPVPLVCRWARASSARTGKSRITSWSRWTSHKTSLAVVSFSTDGSLPRASSVSGDQTPPEIVLLRDGESGRIAEYIRTLRRLPHAPRWILVGGLAVNVRVGRAHRATNDIDTVSPDQDGLVKILVSFDDADAISAAENPVPRPQGRGRRHGLNRRARTAARRAGSGVRAPRRFAMRSALTVTIGTVDDEGCITERVDVEVASRPALVILKTLSFPERINGNYRYKVGSDVQDLYRLVEREDIDVLAAAIAECGPELATFIAGELRHYFAAGTSDLRYTHTRMRSFARNADSLAITEDALSILGVLGETIEELLEARARGIHGSG